MDLGFRAAATTATSHCWRAWGLHTLPVTPPDASAPRQLRTCSWQCLHTWVVLPMPPHPQPLLAGLGRPSESGILVENVGWSWVGDSQEFYVQGGVKQSSVISLSLFLPVMDPLLRQLQASGLCLSISNFYAGPSSTLMMSEPWILVGRP